MLDLPESQGKFASFKARGTVRPVRNLVLCQMLEAGFKPVDCKNCSPDVIRECVEFYKGQLRDSLGNFSEEASHSF